MQERPKLCCDPPWQAVRQTGQFGWTIMEKEQPAPATFDVTFEPGQTSSALCQLAGDWQLSSSTPRAGQAISFLAGGPPISHLTLSTSQLSRWDSSLLVFLQGLFDYCSQQRIEVDSSRLPPGMRQIVALASHAPVYDSASAEKVKSSSFLSIVGLSGLSMAVGARDLLAFIGALAFAMRRAIARRARFRKKDLFLTMEEVGAQALPIVTLISLLVGMTLAFVGAVQLELFNASLYIANLVGVGMTREMGAMMTGLVMVGRTGAAFAARLGAMQVNEEIDALQTWGINPLEHLVLPKVLAMTVMMPLLCIYADLVGILGGMVVGVTTLDIPASQYLAQIREGVDFNDLASGLIKAVVFGIIVAVTGCHHGMNAGRNASAIGDATTLAVVTGIVFIVVADSVLTIIFTITRF